MKKEKSVMVENMVVLAETQNTPKTLIPQEKIERDIDSSASSTCNRMLYDLPFVDW